MQKKISEQSLVNNNLSIQNTEVRIQKDKYSVFCLLTTKVIEMYPNAGS